MSDFDLLVIGAGSGGLAASKRAASYGARVGIVEGGRVGGTCVNVGCVPKKVLHMAALMGEQLSYADRFGWNGASDARFDLSSIARLQHEYIDRLNDIHVHYLDKADVELIRGYASFEDAHTVRVAEKTYTADRLLIAVGNRPLLPDIPGIEHAITNNEFFDLTACPEKAVIVGGGYIALEFAGILNSFGSEVTVVHRNDVFLRGFDREIVQRLTEHMKEEGICFRTQRSLDSIEKQDATLRVKLDDGEVLSCQELIVATGRRGNTDRLQVDKAGVMVNDAGLIPSDDHERTNVEHIYAIGDITGKIDLTPVAIQAGRKLADRLFNNADALMNYRNVPTAVFTPLEIGAVGYTEEQALCDFGEDGVRIFRTDFRPMQHSISGREIRTLMKMIVRASDDVVIGLQMLGEDAAEVVQGFAVAVNAGLTKQAFDDTVGIHPTAAEEFVTMR